MSVERFPASVTMTVEQAISSALRVPNVKEVLIIMCDEDDEVIIRSSRIARRDALWLAEKAKEHALGREI